jgi:hypothetical protein
MKSTPSMSKQEGIFDILKSEHKQVKENFQQIINRRDLKIFLQIISALVVSNFFPICGLGFLEQSWNRGRN